MAKFFILLLLFINSHCEMQEVGGSKKDWFGREIIPEKDEYSCHINGMLGKQPLIACWLVSHLKNIVVENTCRKTAFTSLIKGPRKSGKTFLVKKIAEDTDSHLIILNGSNLLSWNEVRAAYDEANGIANQKKSVIICIDQINEIAIRDDFDQRMSDILCEIRIQMDKYQDNPYIATIALSENKTYLEYCSLKKFNYFDEIKLDLESRKVIIKHFLDMYNESLSDQDILLIAKQTKNFTFNHLEVLIRPYIVHCKWRGIKLNVDALIYQAQFMRDTTAEIEEH